MFEKYSTYEAFLHVNICLWKVKLKDSSNVSQVKGGQKSTVKNIFFRCLVLFLDEN